MRRSWALVSVQTQAAGFASVPMLHRSRREEHRRRRTPMRQRPPRPGSRARSKKKGSSAEIAPTLVYLEGGRPRPSIAMLQDRNGDLEGPTGSPQRDGSMSEARQVRQTPKRDSGPAASFGATRQGHQHAAVSWRTNEGEALTVAASKQGRQSRGVELQPSYSMR